MNSLKKNLVAKHSIVSAKKNGGQLVGSYRAGEAFLHEGDDYYVVKLTPFPFAFYLKKNFEAESDYTVYARRKDHENGAKLWDPIGRAFLNGELKSHLELNLPLLNLTLFMNLYPSK